MDSGPSQDYLYCTHCKDNVSESTFRRHMSKITRTERSSFLARGNQGSGTVSSESDGEPDVNHDYQESDESFSSINNDQQPQDNRNPQRQPHDSSSDSENLDGDDDSEQGDSDDSDEREHPNKEVTEEEFWTDITGDLLDQDISSPPPLPDPKEKKSKLHFVHSILQWLLYFLIVWQTICHVSDNGLAWLLKFLFQFFKALNIHVSDTVIEELIVVFPTSLYMLRQYLKLDRDDFTKYIVCPKCYKCYEYGECLVKVNGVTVAKQCSNKTYLRGKLHLCNSHLVKRVTLKDNTTRFYPLHHYCYNSITNALERLLEKPGFAEKCEEWRENGTNENHGSVLTDVYHGQLWKDFGKFKNENFLNLPRNYGLMLNFDYFQPMKHRKDYSVGVLYFVILNLPRNERFKWENVIVVGIIPSMGREPKCLNEFLIPAVTELKGLWKGLRLNCSLSSVPLIFRAAVLCTSSDIPASRKLCGLKGHSAELGCSKCMKKFPGSFGEKRDYSGFNRESWVSRTNSDHRKGAQKLKNCKKKVEIDKLSKRVGIIFYSVLLDLEYFDIIRFCAIDPMHNLFLGTAKHVFKLWISEGHLSTQQLKQIEERLGMMDVPPDLGRLPKRISSNHGSYTAEQWKNWTLIYSMYALKDILHPEHLNCWQAFVLACKYICKPVLSQEDIIRADGMLLKFCRDFQSLYGNKAVTPNMHLHCHLKDVILDYGPVHSFWCFSFERYNGIIGSIVTNNRSIELQLMRKITTTRLLADISLSETFDPFFGDIITSLQNNSAVVQAAPCQTATFSRLLEYFQLDEKMPLHAINWDNLSALSLPTSHKEIMLDDDDIMILLQVYRVMFPGLQISQEKVSRTIKKYGTVNIYQFVIGSKLAHRSKRSTGIFASWPSTDGSINERTVKKEFGTVEFYFTHTVIVNEVYKTYIFACVNWYMPSIDGPYACLNPLQVANKMQLFPVGASRFLPIQRISTKCAFAITEHEGHEKYVISPLARQFRL